MKNKVERRERVTQSQRNSCARIVGSALLSIGWLVVVAMPVPAWQSAAKLTLDDVVSLLEAKLPESVVLARIKASAARFTPSPQELVRLREAGASEKVMLLLVEPEGAAPSNSQAQTGKALAQEPQFLGVPYFLETSTGKLMELERQSVNTGFKVRGLGWGGRSIVRFEGSASTVRFKSGTQMRFVLKTSSPNADPSSLINIDRLKSLKDHREATVGRVGLINSKTTHGETDVPVQVESCGASLCFTGVVPFTPGEYAITVNGSKTGFLFAID